MDFSRIIEIDFVRCLKALWMHIKWIIVSMVSFFIISAVMIVTSKGIFVEKTIYFSLYC